MARLKQMPMRLAQMPSRIGSRLPPRSEPERSAARDATQPWRKWYKTARWQALRWSVLERDLFTCRLCRRIEADTSQLVADHTLRHGGNEALFWDAANLQCLCKRCHDSTKQSDERRGLSAGA